MADYLDGFNKKSTKAWEYLYRDYYTALCSYVYKIVGDESVSQDVVQDSLIGIWKADLHFSHMEKLTCYLYKAVYTNAIQYLRTERLHHTLLQSYWGREVEDFRPAFCPDSAGGVNSSTTPLYSGITGGTA